MTAITANLQDLITPSGLSIQVGEDSARVASVVAEPLERGFGMTLGNALRRVLLSSLRGAAVTAVQIDGVLHEFSSIPGVREDVTDIVLNIKSLAIRMGGEGPKRIRLTAEGPGEITAGMIETTTDIAIIDPDTVICTLDRGARISMEMTVDTGKGYVPAAENREEGKSIGEVPVDAIFSPVRRVAYRVENARVGQRTDYDRLLMDIETDGTVTPEDAVAQAAHILQQQLATFVNFEESAAAEESAESRLRNVQEKLYRKIDELELSVRSANCLKNDNIVYVGDLVLKTEQDMMRTPNFGRKSLNEIKDTRENMGLRLDMGEEVEWPPESLRDPGSAETY